MNQLQMNQVEVKQAAVNPYRNESGRNDQTGVGKEMQTRSEKNTMETPAVLVFGGTFEGRQVSDYLVSQKIPHTVCVATEYGEEVLKKQEYLNVHQGRMDVTEMCRVLSEGAYVLVVDATHPYAVEVSKNIREACKREKIPYLRYLRPCGAESGWQAAAEGGWPGSGAEGERQTAAEAKWQASAEDSTERGVQRAKRKSGTAGGRQPVQTGGGQTAQSGESSVPEPGREGTDFPAAVRSIRVNSAREAAEYLETQQGRIFLTTGSKELHVFTECISDKSRLFARVLPSAEVIASCRALGLEGKQICGMQGPFSEELNEAMLRQTQADFLVTKDTGISGGFPEKIEAARRMGACCVIIRRPEEAGYGWEELRAQIRQLLSESYRAAGESSKIQTDPGREASEKSRDFTDGIQENGEDDTEHVQENGEDGVEHVQKIGEDDTGHVRENSKGSVDSIPKRSISCIGIGMGTAATLTQEAADAVRNADVLFGAKRILESVRASLFTGDSPGCIKSDRPEPVMVTEYIGTKIAAWLDEHPEYRRAAILMSGDVGFYSGARGIAEAFVTDEVTYYCGISSVVYFASKIPTTWQDAKLVSAHGKQINLLNYVRRYRKLIMLVGGAADVERICGELCEAQQTQIRVTVGTNLSYPEETVTSGSPADFLKCRTTGLHIIMLENPDAAHVLTPGIGDEAFVRGKVPMTKEEVRILSIAKLQLLEDSVVYDVGAGTGSVSVEIARLCTAGVVYAIERNPEGIDLIRENSKKMCVSNVIPVAGMAPEAFEALPAPTHAFIGGSAGNMKEIILALRRKNPKVRITINTVSLESIAELTGLMAELEIKDADIVQASVSKSRLLGRYHMMMAQNPVYIVSFYTRERN